MDSQSVLMVDDHPENLLALERLLEDFELDLVKATSGNEALGLVLDQDFALVLLDVQMPEMDGYEVAELMRQNEKTKHIPIVFVTAIREEEGHMFRGYEAGAVDYLFKPVAPEPVAPEILRSKVNVFCQLHRQRQELKSEIAQRQRAMDELERKQKELQKQCARRGEAEKEARENALRYRSLSELSPVGIITQIDEAVSYLNTAMLKLLGVPDHADVMGRSIVDFASSDSRCGIETYLRNVVRRGGRFDAIEVQLVRDDGITVDVEMYGACVPSGDSVGIELAILDITDRKRMQEELGRLARKDGLTGIDNRRAFDEALDKECRVALRAKSSLSLILVDVDLFKSYNDTYGHLEGDAALRAVATALLKGAKRPADVVARYGGEEFALILPETPVEGAFVLAEEIKTNIETLNITHQHSRVAGHITISLGVATASPDSGIVPDDLIEKADKALYQAKVLGRNQTCAFQDGAVPTTSNTEGAH